VYDINYNKLNSSTFNINLVAEAKEEITFVVGDYEYTQFTINATEDKYDFAITNNAGILEYYKLETYRLDLSNGNLTSIDMEYKVQQVMDNITNNKIALVYIQEIKDKLLDDIKNVILNEKLQQKEIDYTFNRIIKINDERYIANYTETNGLTTISINYLIDENYDLIANLENYNTLFTTRDSIIVGDSTHQYICNLDGIIIKKVAVGSITDINNADYYMVTKTNTVDEKEVTTYYLENKGLTNETAIHTSIANDSTYTYGEHTYVDFDIVNTPNLNLIVRTREVTANNATTYTYEFYNMENKLLYTATEQGELNQGLSSVYEDKDYIIVNFNGGNIVFDK